MPTQKDGESHLRILLLDSKCSSRGTHASLANEVAQFDNWITVGKTRVAMNAYLSDHCWDAVAIHQYDDPNCEMGIRAATEQGLPVVVFSGELALAQEKARVILRDAAARARCARIAALDVTYLGMALRQCVLERSIEPLFIDLDSDILALLSAWYAISLEWEAGAIPEWREANRRVVSGQRTLRQLRAAVDIRLRNLATQLDPSDLATEHAAYHEALVRARDELLFRTGEVAGDSVEAYRPNLIATRDWRDRKPAG